MSEPIDHDQAFADSKVQEMAFGADKMPNIYAAYLDLRKTLYSKPCEGADMTDQIRKEFEQWRDELPNQRYGEPVWEAWQACHESRQEEIDALRSAVSSLTTICITQVGEDYNDAVHAAYLKGVEALAGYKAPTEPTEVYSPNTIVIDDKCRKCAGEMHDGKAIAQTFTGVPDFIGSDEVVTVSPNGSGKMIECSKCQDCGWSTT